MAISENVFCVGSVTLIGVTGIRVVVEAATTNQLPGMSIIGLPDTAVGEAKQRVRLAAQSCGFKLTKRMVIVNLSPAALPKHGSGFDLPIALSALAASGVFNSNLLLNIAHVGELGLDGSVRRPAGLFTLVKAAQELGFHAVMVPVDAVTEASLVPNITVIAVESLRDAVGWYARIGTVQNPKLFLKDSIDDVLFSQGKAKINSKQDETFLTHDTRTTVQERFMQTLGFELPLSEPDMRDIVGHEDAIGGLLVAAAGRHHVSLIGPPGIGKSMLAERMPSVLPELTEDEALEVTRIAALENNCIEALVFQPPFENPHHSISLAGLIGGVAGGVVRAGAITKASLGVLYLDEAPEFRRNVLEGLREPLENKQIQINRFNVQATLPANFQLILASNPCPCGNALTREAGIHCMCSASNKIKYKQRLSAPLLDRIDVQCVLQRISYIAHDVRLGSSSVSSARLQKRVIEARDAAADRFRDFPWNVNSEFPGRYLRSSKFRLSKECTSLLDRALHRGSITLRGYDKVLRLAWSSADLNGKNSPTSDDIGYALSLRNGV